METIVLSLTLALTAAGLMTAVSAIAAPAVLRLRAVPQSAGRR